MPGGVFPFRKEFFTLRPGALPRQNRAGHFAPGGRGKRAFPEIFRKTGKTPEKPVATPFRRDYNEIYFS